MAGSGGSGGGAGGFGSLAGAGAASLGAGAIHAAAAAANGDLPRLSVLFQALAGLQLIWGAWALVGGRRGGTIAGFGLGAGAAIGWVFARAVGLDVVDGFGADSPLGWSDSIAAALAAVAAGICARRILDDRPASESTVGRHVGAVAIVLASLVGVSQASTDGGPDSAAPEAGAPTAAAMPTGVHIHGADAGAAGGGPVGGGGHHHGGGGTEAVVPPVAYEPSMAAPGGRRVDLSGVAGVRPEQQARAEELVERTIDALQRWSDPAVAEADGFQPLGDGATGFEHHIDPAALVDDRTLDPQHPEALVYDTSGPDKELVAAVYMLPAGSRSSTAPDVGGRLTSWQLRSDLCALEADPPRIVGSTAADGSCEAPARKLAPVPALHVWIKANPCGPYASPEVLAAGRNAARGPAACGGAAGG